VVGLWPVEAVAERQQLDHVVRTELLGVSLLVHTGDHLQPVDLQVSDHGIHLIESRQHLAAAHRPHRPLAPEFHTVNDRHTHRQFPNPEPLIFKAFGLSTGILPGIHSR